MSKSLRFGLLAVLLVALIAALVWLRPAAKEPEAQSSAPASRLETLAEIDLSAPPRRTLDVQSWTTEQGSRVLFFESHELPMFDLQLTFAAGSSRDGELPGLASLTNAMLNEGSGTLDADQIAAGFEDLGAQFANGTYRDMAVASLRSLSNEEQRQAALALFTQVVAQPSFPEEPMLRLKNQYQAGFEYQKQQPGKLAALELFKRLYGQHPYAQPTDGNPQSIRAIQVGQLKAFHQQAYSAGNAVIALVGDLDREQAEHIASQLSLALPQGPGLPPLPKPERPEPGQVHVEYPSNQTHIMLAQAGVARGDADYPALFLGNQILGGGGFGTRLMEEVREKRGLTYGVYSAFSPMQVGGPFMINLQTRADQSEGTLELVRELLRDYLDKGPSQQELDNAKRELAGSFPLRTTSNGDIVGLLASTGFYQLPLDYQERFLEQVQALTAEQVKAALNKHLDADAFVIVTAGPTVEQKPLPPPTERASSAAEAARVHE